MSNKEQNKKKKKDDKPSTLTSCNENAYIVNKNEVREGTGLSKDAKILME
jgi:hypothetical protein